MKLSRPEKNTIEVSEAKKQIVKNLFESDLSEEYIAMQVDLEIPIVISILKEFDAYRAIADTAA
jgi:hypothetical protein